MSTVDFQRAANPFASRFLAPGASPYRWVDPANRTLCSSDHDSLDWLAGRVGRRRCSAIVGPHGSGKSSLLIALERSLRPRFPRIRQLHVSSRRTPRQAWQVVRSIGGSQPAELWLVEGLERCGPWLRNLVAAIARCRSAFVLATLHRDHRGWQTVWRTDLDATFAGQLTRQRLRDWPDHIQPLLQAWDERWAAAEGNLRELWFQLFDEFESLERASARCTGTSVCSS